MEESDNIRLRKVVNFAQEELEKVQLVNPDENQIYDDEKADKVLSDKQLQTSNNNSTLSVENLCWLAASIFCVYFSDIINIMMHDERIHRSLMFVSFILIAINVLIAFYMIVWLTHVKKINSNKWNEVNPTLIPIATACFVSGSIILIISLWPVYTWLTAPLLFTIFMGFVVIVINVPSIV